MEKIAVSHPIQQSKIVSVIESFISKLNQNDLLQNMQLILKHPPTSQITRAIDPKFIANCVYVCVSFQLSSIVKGVEDLRTEQILQEMRDFYFYMSTQGGWKSQFQFQRSIVCITKIVSDFFNQAFSDVTIDEKLESEIYVILIHVLMGIKVGTKSFQLLKKKYLKSKQQSNCGSSSEKKQRKTQRQRSNNKSNKRDSGSVSIFNRTQPTLKKLTSIFPQTPKSPTDLFIQNLRQDLYVTPLPQIMKEKKSIQSFSIEKRELNKFSTTAGSQFFRVQEQKCKKFPFLSNQLSISMHSEIIQRHVSIAENTKPLKIKYRSPNFSGHLVVFKNKPPSKNQNSDEYNLMKQKQKQQKWKLSSQQWKKIITNLKQNFIKKQQKTDCMNQFRRTIHQYEYQNPSKQLQKRKDKLTKQLKSQNQNTNLKQSQTTKPQKNRNTPQNESQATPNIDGGVQNFKQVFLTQNQNYLDEKIPKINKTMLREERKHFDQEVLHRHEKIKYTMFMLPKMGKKNTRVC